MGNVVTSNPDAEARLAIWEAICDSADALTEYCTVYRSAVPTEKGRLAFGMSIRDVPTWKLIEALSLLAILSRSDRVLDSHVCNLFGRTGPIRFQEEGAVRFLWAQPTVLGPGSSLGSRPDLVISSTSDPPAAASILRIIECKCRKNLSAPDIRGEFGKARDLGVKSYFIWSFNTPSAHLTEGPRRLGLNLETLAFDSPRRGDWIRTPEELGRYVANTLEKARVERRFERFLREAGADLTLNDLERDWPCKECGHLNLSAATRCAVCQLPRR